MTTAPAATEAAGSCDATWRLRPWLARLCLALGLGVALALAAWSLAPALRGDGWRWAALALDTVALGCAVALRRPREWLRTESLTLIAGTASYALAWTAALGHRPPAAFVAAALVALVAICSATVSSAAAGIAGRPPWPRWYAPALLAVAGATLLIRGWTSDGISAYAATVAVLAAGAPGALAVALGAPLRLAARRGDEAGIQLHHTAALPAALAVDTLVLDGLTTLVEGKHVSSVDPLDETHLRNLRWFAGALAHASDHPVGRAIAKLAGRGNLSDVREHAGLGISGSVDRHPVRVGSPDWLGLPDAPPDGATQTVAVEVDARVLGTISVVDTVRDGSGEAVAALRAMGVEPVLVTDAPMARAQAITGQVGIESTLRPPLAQVMAQRSDEGARVAVLGPTARRAALVLGPQSDRISLERCDIVSAARAVGLCRDAAREVQLCARIALAWHAAMVALAASGVLVPWLAAVAALLGMGLVLGISHTTKLPRLAAPALSRV
ncbi:HAD family hydrolase [Nocardioides sp. DS6]|uniref:HAD family hydrolase n=1 Tax=Nocardioides eburneus TaxID=3231482 RepID=A0ABV3SZV4_9ACTN